MDKQRTNSELPSPPGSCTNYTVNILFLGIFFGLMYGLINLFPQMPLAWLSCSCLLATVIPLSLYELLVLKTYQRPSTGLLAKTGEFNRERVVIKLIGLVGTFLIILYSYFFIPFYRNSFFAPFFEYLKVLSPFIILLCMVYFIKIDPRQADPYDGYWHMGCLLTGRLKNVNGIILKEYLLVWFIKAFFTPIMLGILVKNIQEILLFNWYAHPKFFYSAYLFLLLLFYTVDVIYGFLGYMLTCRVLDNHIRSTEPTFLGWVTCLACYYPFSQLYGISLLKYDEGFTWAEWFSFSPFSYYFIGSLIIIFSLIYALATVAIGYRMSNLTYRGIITSGPYRLTKHPAYMSKVLSWWLISLPFFSTGGGKGALKQTLALAGISLIYYLRARTEENHLSNYPEYVEYANWIKEHGAFHFLTKYFPFWQYSENKVKRWNSIVWFKKLK
ncbi:MAG: hypothetical protein HQL24_02490 [Candidatus Omnitrophica bacterium]|nr:hypothetical protein [Candidatus Omnitrophota bacterium]